jgi:hypothetical protein
MPRIIAAFAYRYEPDWLVDQLRENLSWVDGFAELDERGRSDLWSPRAQRNADLRAIALSMEPDWIYWTAPDERLEDRGARLLRLLSRRAPARYRLHLREMWTPDAYRVDGLWGAKGHTRFFRPGVKRTKAPDPTTTINLNIYHLKMIDPANRAERARVHGIANTWDNKARGFSYMLAESGLRLETIPEGRGYSPAYRPYLFDVQGNG